MISERGSTCYRLGRPSSSVGVQSERFFFAFIGSVATSGLVETRRWFPRGVKMEWEWGVGSGE